MVQFVVVQQQRCIQEVGCNFRYVINFVRRLLEVAYLTYNVGNLKMKSCVSLDAMRDGGGPGHSSRSIRTYHTHFGEVEQSIRCKVGRALLDEGQVGQIHAQVRNAGWIAPVQCLAHHTKPSIRAHHGLQFSDCRFDLAVGGDGNKQKRRLADRTRTTDRGIGFIKMHIIAPWW